jgi:Tfp pilus assembly protein PilF
MNNKSKGKSRSESSAPPRSPKNLKAGSLSQQTQVGNRLQSIVVCVFLALAVWAVFGQTLRHEFVSYDDNVYVYANPAITQGLSFHGVVWIFTHLSSPDDWLPLTALSHAVDWQLYGPNATGHHLTNILLHAANAILLFLVLQKMTGALWRNAFVAAVFAIHPLRVESVAWVAERKDVLSGLFFMLTLWAYTRCAQKRPKAEDQDSSAGRVNSGIDPRRWTLNYYLALVFFALGLLSKSMLVTVPFVLLLLDYWPLGRFANWRSFPSLLAEKIPFLLLSVVACVATVLTQKQTILAVHGLTFPSRVGNALEAYAEYLWQMLYPAGLAVLYPYPANHLSVWRVGLSLVVLLTISVGVLAGRRTYPYLLVGWLWYLGMLVPVIGFIQVGVQARADRYTYLPQIGLYLLVAWGAVELCGRWRYRWLVLGSVAGAILVALLARAYAQTNYWKDSVTLWTHDLACTTDNSTAEGYLGLALADQGKMTEAIQRYERALLLNPDNTDAQINLGNGLVSQGNLTEAIQHYERALQLEPDSPDAHYDLGIALASQGNLTEAIQHYQRALQLKPDVPETLNCLGLALAAQGKLAEAIQCYERALQLKPDYIEAFNSLGMALTRQGKLDEARQQFERALQLKPDDPEILNNLGIVFAAQGKLDEAILRLQQALQLAIARGDAKLAEAIRARIEAVKSNSVQPQTP